MLYNRQILSFLESKGIQSLWHFTSIEHLPNIFLHKGLRSKEYLEKKGLLRELDTGGDELSHQLDKDLGNWDKVSLSFTPFTPMAYHKKQEKHLVFIEIDYRVCAVNGSVFTDRNATRLRNGQQRGEGIFGLNLIKWDYILGKPKPWDKDWQKYVQAEALIPDLVNEIYFKKIHFISEASLEFGKSLCYDYENKFHLFKISPEVFQDYKHYERAIIFPHLQRVIFSLERINKQNFDQINEDAQIIYKNRPFWIKAELFALSGTKAYIRIYNLEEELLLEENIVFEKEDNWVWFPKIDLIKNRKISNNTIFCEIWLDDVRWFERMVMLK